jgi:DNA-directed RNA polymerase subunit alpha
MDQSKDALTEAAKVLIHHFMLFSDERITLWLKSLKQNLMMRIIT